MNPKTSENKQPPISSNFMKGLIGCLLLFIAPIFAIFIAFYGCSVDQGCVSIPGKDLFIYQLL